jgi:hypothetical protein
MKPRLDLMFRRGCETLSKQSVFGWNETARNMLETSMKQGETFAKHFEKQRPKHAKHGPIGPFRVSGCATGCIQQS